MLYIVISISWIQFQLSIPCLIDINLMVLWAPSRPKIPTLVISFVVIFSTRRNDRPHPSSTEMVGFCKSKCLALPIPSMGLVYLPTSVFFFGVNVGKYTIHGWYGLVLLMFRPFLVVHLFTCALPLICFKMDCIDGGHLILAWFGSENPDYMLKWVECSGTSSPTVIKS